MHRIHRTSYREEPPTDDTDVHRCRRVWHPCHTHAAKFCKFCEFCGRTAHSKHLCKSVPSVGEKIFPQNARKLLAEKSLPQMSTELTEPLAEKGLPRMAQMFTDVGGYGIPAIPTLPNSVNSVNSVGGKRFPQNARKLLAEKSLPQMAQMRTDVGGYGIPAIPTLPNSVNSVNSVGGKRFPQNARNAQNLLQRRASHR